MPCLFFLFLLLICYQDSPTAISVGEIARSPIFFFLPVLLCWNLLSPRLEEDIYRNFSRLLFALIIIFIIITTINGVYWFFFMQRGVSFLNENVVIKCLKEVVYFFQFYLLYLSSVRFFEYFLKNNIEQLVRVLTYFIIFLLLILVVELLTYPNAFPFLHNDVPYYRIRLLTSESSWTGSIIVTLSTIYLALAKTKTQKILGFVFLFLNIALTGSKMIMVCMPLAFLIIYLRKRSFKRIILAVSLGILAYFIILPVIVSSFTVDLEEYTSVVSRTTSFLTGLITGTKSVIGVGGFYPYYFINNMNSAVDMILSVLKFGNTSEVEGWGSDGFKAISGGSTFAHLIMLIGVFGFLFYIVLIKKLLRLSRDNNYLFFAVIYFIISNLFTEVFLLRLMWPVFFAFLSFYKIHENELKNLNSNS